MSQEANAAPQPSYEQIAANPALLETMTDAQIDALANAHGEPAGEAQPAEPGEKAGSATPDAAIQSQTEAPAQPKGVQTKDGEHVIPYSVLEREREARARAEQMLQAQAAEIERLAAGGKPADEGEGDAVQLSEDDLTQLDQDLPGVAKAIRAQQETIKALMGTVQTLQQDQQVARSVQQEAVKDEIDVAIEANPDLKAWRESSNAEANPDPIMWNRAADIDAVLREDPAWKDRPVAERFAKVAETVKAIYGAPTQPKPGASPKDTQAALDAKAAAALAAAEKSGASAPRSLGDIPGGTTPAVDEAAALLEKDGAELTAAFMAMTPEQIEAKLARLR
jgi:hypothetical protein